jgi:hypothetical protein
MARSLSSAKRQQIQLRKLERQYRGKVAAEIARAMRLMLDAYARTGSIPNLPEETYPRLIELWREMARSSIEAFGNDIVDQGKATGRPLETKSFFDFFMRLADEWLGMEMIRRRITSVAETTRANIVSQVRIGQAEGLGVAQISQRIAKAVPSISTQRGALIARTETHGAANFGANKVAQTIGFTLQKQWVAAEDHRTRPFHAAANGQMVDLNQPFIVGGEMLMYPGDEAGSPWNTINCRCTTVYEVVDEAQTVPAVQTAYDAAPVFTYQNFKPSKNVKEAVARMTGTVAERIDLPSGAKIDMVNDTHSALLEFQERFGYGQLSYLGDWKKAGPRYKWSNSNIAAFDMNRDYYVSAAKGFNFDMIDATIEVARANSKAHYASALNIVNKRSAANTLSVDVIDRFMRMDQSKYKWTIADTPKDVVFHELGHRLHSKMMNEINGLLPNRFFASEWGLLLSRYSQTSNEELVAESFSLYMQGDASQFFRIYPPLLRIFQNLDKVAT